jgi:membrane-bound serine protease (ClpP class)
VSVPLVVSVGIFLGLVFFVIIGFALRAQRAPIRIGVESLPGKVGTARTDIGESGQLQVGAELWSAEAAEAGQVIKAGEKVEVVRVEGLRLIVKKAGQL